MYFALVSKFSIFSCSCCVVYYVLYYSIGVLRYLILLLLLMCRLTVYITVYPMRFWFHGWWKVSVFYVIVVLITWHVHVWGCMFHSLLCIIDQYDICCVLR